MRAERREREKIHSKDVSERAIEPHEVVQNVGTSMKYTSVAVRMGTWKIREHVDIP